MACWSNKSNWTNKPYSI